MEYDKDKPVKIDWSLHYKWVQQSARHDTDEQAETYQILVNIEKDENKVATRPTYGSIDELMAAVRDM